MNQINDKTFSLALKLQQALRRFRVQLEFKTNLLQIYPFINHLMFATDNYWLEHASDEECFKDMLGLYKILLETHLLIWLLDDDSIGRYLQETGQLQHRLFASETQDEIIKRMKWLHTQVPVFFPARDALYLGLSTQNMCAITENTMLLYLDQYSTVQLTRDPFLNYNASSEGKIIIGILSPRLGFNNALTHMLQPLFANFRPDQFQLILFSTHHDYEPWIDNLDRMWMRKFAFGRSPIQFVELASTRIHFATICMKKPKMEYLESFADKLGEHKCHVLFDLTDVYVQDANPEVIIRHRFSISKVVMYHPIAFPASSGCLNVDVLLSDEVVVPKNEHDLFLERIAHLPGTVYPGACRDLFPHLVHKMELVFDGNIMILNSTNPIPKWITRLAKHIWVGLNFGEVGSLNHVSIYGTQFVNGDVMPMTYFFGQEVVGGVKQLPPSCIVVTTRTQYGLPSNRQILGLFTDLPKLSPTILSCYLQILKQVEDVVLWIYSPNGENESTQLENVVKYFANHKLDVGDRIFTCRDLPLEVHVRRLQLAAVHLDSFPCNGQYTSVDIFVSGGLVITAGWGDTIASRIGESMARASGMEYLIARDKNDMVRKCIKILTNPSWHDELKRRMQLRLNLAMMFSSEISAYSLQELCKQVLKKDATKRRFAFTDNPEGIFQYRTLGRGSPIQPNQKVMQLYMRIMGLIRSDDNDTPMTLAYNQAFIDEIEDENDGMGNYAGLLNDDQLLEPARVAINFYPKLDLYNNPARFELQALDPNICIAQRVLVTEMLSSAVYGVLKAIQIALSGPKALPYPSGPILAAVFTNILNERMILTDIPKIPAEEHHLAGFLQTLNIQFERPQQYINLLKYFRSDENGNVTICENQAQNYYCLFLSNLSNTIKWNIQRDAYELCSLSEQNTKHANEFFQRNFHYCPFCPIGKHQGIKDYETFRLHYHSNHRFASRFPHQCRTCGMGFETEEACKLHCDDGDTHRQKDHFKWKVFERVGNPSLDFSSLQVDEDTFDLDLFFPLEDNIKNYCRKPWQFSRGQKQLTFCWIERGANLALDKMHDEPMLCGGTHASLHQFVYYLSANLLTLRTPILSKLPELIDKDDKYSVKELQGRLGDFQFYNDIQLHGFLDMFSNGEVSNFGRWTIKQLTGKQCPCVGNVQSHSLEIHLDSKITKRRCGICGFIYPPDSRYMVVKKLHSLIHTVLKLQTNWSPKPL